MANLKILAKETAIYGMSSIIGRFLNYLLVPLYTAKLSAESGGYGVITNVYALTALMMVLLTYGMETGFFRFANKPGAEPMRVYCTVLIPVVISSLAFIAVVLLNLPPFPSLLHFSLYAQFIIPIASVIFYAVLHALTPSSPHYLTLVS